MSRWSVSSGQRNENSRTAEIDGGLAGEKNTAACGPALQRARPGGRAGAGRLGESRVGSSEIGHSCAAVEHAPGARTSGSIESRTLIVQRFGSEKQLRLLLSARQTNRQSAAVVARTTG